MPSTSKTDSKSDKKKISVSTIKANDPEHAFQILKVQYTALGYKIKKDEEIPKSVRDFGIDFVAENDDLQVAVILIEPDKIFSDTHWQDLLKSARSVLRPPSSLELRPYRRILPWRKRHAQRLKTFAKIIASCIGVMGIGSGVVYGYLNLPKSRSVDSSNGRLSNQPTTLSEQTPSVGSGSSQGDTPQQSKPLRLASSAVSALQNTPSGRTAPAPPAEPLEQALNSYLLQQLGSDFAAHHYQGVYLKFWSSVSPTYDNGTASCSVDGSIESSERPVLPEMTGPTRWSSTGVTPEQTKEDACKRSVDDIIYRYRHL